MIITPIAPLSCAIVILSTNGQLPRMITAILPLTAAAPAAVCCTSIPVSGLGAGTPGSGAETHGSHRLPQELMCC
jgi:hypothetical protein